jgi:hypothetical protein
VRRIHEAGYHLPPGDAWKCRLGVSLATEEVLLVNIEQLLRTNFPWQQVAPIEFNDPEFRLTRAEQMRFLRGYLEKTHAPSSSLRAAERQAAE